MVFGLQDDAISDVINNKLCDTNRANITVRREKFKRHHTTNVYRILAEKCITVGWK
jgi:hypothetical protein